MSYDPNKLVLLKALKDLATRVKQSDDTLAAALAAKADKATTLAGYGITDAYTKGEIDGKVSSVYKPAGSVAFADLPAAAEATLGNVYNVTDAFTTTADFVEGAGNVKINGVETPVVSIATDAEVAEMLAEVFGDEA